MGMIASGLLSVELPDHVSSPWNRLSTFASLQCHKKHGNRILCKTSIPTFPSHCKPSGLVPDSCLRLLHTTQGRSSTRGLQELGEIWDKASAAPPPPSRVSPFFAPEGSSAIATTPHCGTVLAVGRAAGRSDARITAPIRSAIGSSARDCEGRSADLREICPERSSVQASQAMSANC